MQTPPRTKPNKKFSALLPQHLSIRTQLMLFLCAASLVSLFFIWLFFTHLLQPLYHSVLINYLEAQMDEIVIFIGAIVLLLSLITAWLFSRWFIKPISILTKAANSIAKGNYNIVVPPMRNNELGELSDAFNTMAKEVRRSAELQNELVANVSHDLRTPLTLIRGYAETVRDITGEKKEKREDAMNIIIDETERLTALVNSVLELSKVSAGVEKFAPVPFDFVAFSARFAERYQGVCRQNGWQLVLDLPETPLPIVADPTMLERAIDNLLSNAMRHLGADNTFILRAYQTPAGHCRIEVEDHGEGIPQEEQQFLFKRYYRTRHDAGKRGTGLGLAIVRAILTQHGFAYGVESTLNTQTIFWFIAHQGQPTPTHTGKEPE